MDIYTRKSAYIMKCGEKYNINHFKPLHKNHIIQFITSTHKALQCCIVNAMQQNSNIIFTKSPLLQIYNLRTFKEILR